MGMVQSNGARGSPGRSSFRDGHKSKSRGRPEQLPTLCEKTQRVEAAATHFLRYTERDNVVPGKIRRQGLERLKRGCAPNSWQAKHQPVLTLYLGIGWRITL